VAGHWSRFGLEESLVFLKIYGGGGGSVNLTRLLRRNIIFFFGSSLILYRLLWNEFYFWNLVFRWNWSAFGMHLSILLLIF
jgi:hypothetical protein